MQSPLLLRQLTRRRGWGRRLKYSSVVAILSVVVCVVGSLLRHDRQWTTHLLAVYKGSTTRKTGVAENRGGQDPDEYNGNTAAKDSYYLGQQELPDWLAAYVQLHDGDASASASGRSNDSNRNATTSSSYYLKWRCFGQCGGVGDRMSGIVRAFYMAMCTDRRFYVEWTRPSRLSQFLQPNLVPWDISDSDSSGGTNRASDSFGQQRLQSSETALHGEQEERHRQRKLSHQDTTASLTKNITMASSRQQQLQVLVIRAVDQRYNPFLMDPSKLPKSANVQISTNLWPNDFEETKFMAPTATTVEDDNSNNNNTQGKLLKPPQQQRCMKNYWNRFPEQQQNVTTLPPHYYFRTAFWTLFRYSPVVVQEVERIRRELNLTSSSSTTTTTAAATTNTDDDIGDTGSRSVADTYVGVHIRTGQNAAFRDKLRGGSNKTAWPEFYACASRIRHGLIDLCRGHNNGDDNDDDRSDENDIPIYVASDSSTLKEAFLRFDEGRGSIRTIQDLEIYHIDRAHKIEDKGRAELGVWADLKLLSEATCLVESTSRFSRLANWLSYQQPRCAVNVFDCTPTTISEALSHVTTKEVCGLT